ncbi:MAG: dockerin type I repeat-containing protein [Planctomycetota bacterium]|jgi:hypothetical protein
MRRISIDLVGSESILTTLCLVGLLTVVPAFGQAGGDYGLTWSTIDGGGGQSTGGQYVLTGTIGQPDAAYSAGGPYEVFGGFWAYKPMCWLASECAGQPSGDATCDGSVNLADLFALKAHFGKCAPWTPPECCADFTQDGCINLADLFALKAGFGTSGHVPSTGNQDCPP